MKLIGPEGTPSDDDNDDDDCFRLSIHFENDTTGTTGTMMMMLMMMMMMIMTKGTKVIVSEIIQSWSAQTLKHSSATRGFPTLLS